MQRPENPDEVYKWSMQQLKNFQYGPKTWEAYDARFFTPLAPYSNHFKSWKTASIPFWKGECLAGKSIAVWTEQGVGDEILQGNLVTALLLSPLATSAAIDLYVSGKVVPLFQAAFPQVRAVVDRDKNTPVKYDFQIPMLSLANWVKPGKLMLADGPKRLPNPVKTVGISWKSNSPGFGRKKNLEIKEILKHVPWKDAIIIPLQYGDKDTVRREFMEGLEGTGFSYDTSGLDTYTMYDPLDASRQLAWVDAVVSISNFTVHLAGAMGIPTTVLLTSRLGPVSTIWYWGDRGNKTPWYPSLTIKRLYT